MNTGTPTPRTDAAIALQQAAPAAFSELATVARTLERELSEAKARVAELERELATTKSWTDSDQKLPEDEAIMEAHPVGSKLTTADTIYLEAIRLVSAKRSKYALVDLVNWLLARISDLSRNQCEKEPAWTLKIYDNTGDKAVVHYEPLYRKAKYEN